MLMNVLVKGQQHLVIIPISGKEVKIKDEKKIMLIKSSGGIYIIWMET